MTSPKIDNSAAKFDRIRRAHQSEVAEDYVEMIAELIERPAKRGRLIWLPDLV
jgi:DtxR family manganese transport transcriptional regulator